MITMILLVLAFVCFLLAAIENASPHYNRLVACGLAAFVAASLFGRV